MTNVAPAPDLISRNDALSFAARTRTNLEALERLAASGESVHRVTHLVNSLLGLVIVPKERQFTAHIQDLSLAELEHRGWPRWKVIVGVSDTLGELLRRIRNASAHGRFVFSSDSPNPAEVWVELSDFRKSQPNEPVWMARITAADLQTFCYRLIDEIENTIG